MIEIQKNSSSTLTLSTSGTATDVKINIKYDWGDLVLADTSIAGTGTIFSYTLSSSDTDTCGINKATWTYTISGITYTTSTYFNVYQPYITSNDFFIEFPELKNQFLNTLSQVDEVKFGSVERKIRQIIDTYCGQNFQSIPSKTLNLDGSDSDILHTYYRLNTLTEVMLDSTDDISLYIEKASESDYHIRRIRTLVGTKDYLLPELSGDFTGRFFRKNHTYNILGDWGWPYVPLNISEASKLLISDFSNQDSANRRHNIVFTGVGPVQTNYRGDLTGTTGNVDADVLLMDYTRFVMDWI